MPNFEEFLDRLNFLGHFLESVYSELGKSYPRSILYLAIFDDNFSIIRHSLIKQIFFSNLGLSRPLSGVFSFSRYINFTVVNDDRNQKRIRKSKHQTIARF